MSKVREQRAVAFIFARGGSTGIPQKNLQKIGDFSLIARAIRTALAVGEISEVILSTDDEEIAEEGRLHGARTPFVRPAELASAKTPEWQAWQHAVGHPSIKPFDTFISVPPTAPLRTSGDLECCLQFYHEGSADLVLTGTGSARSPFFNLVKRDQEGAISVFSKLDGGITRRQDAPQTYDLTTVAYVSSPGHILNSTGVFDGTVGLIHVPRARAVDIDEQIDLETARFYFENPHFLGGNSYPVR